MNKLHDWRPHFSGTLMGALGLFAACIIYLAVSLGNYTSSDIEVYQRLVHGIDDDISMKEKEHVSSQQRSGLQKDLLLSGKDGRLEARLISERSELALEKRAGRISVIERMDNVTCFMQEEMLAILPDGRKALRQPDGRFLIKDQDPSLPEAWLSSDLNAHAAIPMQLVRRLDAKTATYYYKDDLFVAENVTVNRYLTTGHELQVAGEMHPLMQGVAEYVEFSLRGAEKKLQARRLRATFFSEGEI